jgi:hypothetical protein
VEERGGGGGGEEEEDAAVVRGPGTCNFRDFLEERQGELRVARAEVEHGQAVHARQVIGPHLQARAVPGAVSTASSVKWRWQPITSHELPSRRLHP